MIEIERYAFPDERSIATDFRLKHILGLYATCLIDDVDGPVPRIATDELLEYFDAISGQSCQVAVDEDITVGMASYDLSRKLHT